MVKKIFITGGSASGKSHLSSRLKESLGKHAIIISQDSFYKSTGKKSTNFDIPSALDMAATKELFENLKKGDVVKIPIYDFTVNKVVGHKEITIPDVIIFEGLFTLHDPELRAMADLKIFVHTPSDTRLSRRITRDVQTRGRTVESVIDRWIKEVQPSYLKYISGLKKESDIIIPWSSINKKSIKSIIASIIFLDKNLEELIKKVI